MPPGSKFLFERSQRRGKALARHQRETAKIEKSVSKPAFDSDLALLHLVHMEPNSFIPTIQGVGGLYTKRLHQQARRKKYAQLKAAYVALQTFKQYDKPAQVEIVRSMIYEIEKLDIELRPTANSRRPHKPDPISLILKLLLVYDIQDPTDRSVLSRDRRALSRGGLLKLTADEFGEQVSQLRSYKAPQQRVSDAVKTSVAPTPPQAAHISAPEAITTLQAQLLKADRLKKNSTSLCVIKTDADGVATVIRAEVVYRSEADYRNRDKAHFKTSLKESAQVLRHPPSRTAGR